MDENPFVNLVNDFESSLKSFISIYNPELTENKTNYEFGKKASLNQIELNKKMIEQASEEMYQKARDLELMFLKYRLDILNNAPEQLVQEEISCLRAELKRKEELLSDTKRKVSNYENSLKQFSAKLDQDVKARNEMSAYNYMPMEFQQQQPPVPQPNIQSYPGSVPGGQY